MGARKDPRGWHSRGYLPHFDSPETIQHVVFRTVDSLPASVIGTLPDGAAERRREIDARLDRCEGSRPLDDPRAARIVEEAIRHFDGDRYSLFAWCVMPNHVHAVAEFSAGFPLGDVVRSWKTFSARKINKPNAAPGVFWALDYFDRYMRNETDLAATIGYVERNPVVAGLVERPEDWLWSSARLKR